MAKNKCDTRENLLRQLLNYSKLATRPNLSAGARTVLMLQCEHIESLLNKMDGL